MFFIPCDNWETFLIQVYRYPEIFCNHFAVAFFEAGVLKEVCILCPLSPQYHYNATNTNDAN